MSDSPAVSEQLLATINAQNHDLGLILFGYPLWNIAMTMIAVVVSSVIVLVVYANMTISEDDKPKAKKSNPNLPEPSQVVSLYVYPIKSCRGIQVDSCKLRKTGLDLDRHWMFVDSQTKEFLTIRSDPSMTLIDTTLTGPNKVPNGGAWTDLNIGVHGTDAEISIPCYPTQEWLSQNCKLVEVEIWGAKTDAWKYSDEINSVFTDFFKKNVLLVYKGPTPRMAGGNGDVSLYGKEEPHHFADVMSLQVASEASLQDLNSRLLEHGEKEITIERFRPNIIIKGNKPWEEDNWKKVRINTVEHEREMLWRTPLDVLARCARCQVPNVNPDTAEKHAKEPWDTLMKFRRVDPGGVAKYKPCFGMLCIPNKDGYVRIGSELEVMEVTDKHLYNKAKFAEL